MKKTFRKAIAVLLAVLMVAFSVPFSALAGTPDAPDMFASGGSDYTVKQNRKWWVDDGVDVSLDKLQSTPEFWSYNSDEKWNTSGSWNFDLGSRVENFADNGYEDHRNDWKPVVAATVSLQGTNEGMAEAVAKVKNKSDTNAIKKYVAQYFGNYYGANAAHTYEAVKESGNIVNPAKLKAGQRIAITVELGGLDIMESGQFKGKFNKEYLKAAAYSSKPSRGDTWKAVTSGAAGCIADGTALYPTAIAFAGNNVNVEDGTWYGAITGKAAVAGDGNTSNYIGTDSNGVKPFGKYGLVSFTYSFEVLKDCDASEVFTFDHDIAGTEFEPYYRFALSEQNLQNPELFLITYDDTKSTFANWTQIWTDYAKDSAPETKEYTITFKNAAGTVVDTQKVKEGETPTAPSTNTPATKNVSDGAGHHSHNEYSWPAVSPATADTIYDEVATVVKADCQYTYSVVTPATYKDTGVGRYTCTDPDCAYSYDVTIDKLVCDHADTKVVNKADSTLVKTGYTGDTVCNTCGETIATGTTIAKLDGTNYYAALKDAKNVDASKFTEASYAKLAAALKAYDQATVEAYTDQADVENAATALKAAVTGLEALPTTDTYTYTFIGGSTQDVIVDKGATPTAPANTAAKAPEKNGDGTHTTTSYTWSKTGDFTFAEVAKDAVDKCSYKSEVVIEPTYTEMGTTKYTCTVCGYSYTAKDIDKLVCDHADTKVVNAQAATLVKTGYTGDTVCNTCGETIAKGTTIPKLDGTAYYKALEDAKAVNADNYTDESVAAVADAIKANAQATVETYTMQADVDKAADALKAAVSGLVKAVNVEVAATDLGSTTLNGKAQASAKVAVNGEVTLTATPVDGAEFVGWKVNNTLVSTDAEYTTTVVANTTFVPVFKETAADTFTVVFVDSYGIVIDSTQYTKGQKVVAPTAPARPGYTFAGWSLSDDAIAALQEGATIVAQYVKDEVKTYTVKADGATITTAKASAEGVLDGVTYDTKVTVTKAGTKAWTVNGATVAYGDTYTFYCGSDIELTAVADTTETASTKVAMVDSSLINGSTYKVAFLATRTIAPTDTIVKQGFVYGVDMAASDLVLENVGKAAGSANKTVKVAYADNSYEQTSLVYGVGGNNAGHSANAVAFVTVKASDGSINTVYSELASYNY